MATSRGRPCRRPYPTPYGRNDALWNSPITGYRASKRYGDGRNRTTGVFILTFASDKETPPVQKTPCLLHFWQSCPFLLTCKGQ